MPSKTPAQARLMRAVAHGWKPDRIKGPSRAVAREFVKADKKWTGGLAAMNEINSGVARTLDFAHGGPVLPLTDTAQIFEVSNNPGSGNPDQAIDLSSWRHTGGGRSPRVTRILVQSLEAQGYTKGEGLIWNPPGGTILAHAEPSEPRVIPGAVGAPPAGSTPNAAAVAPPWTPERAAATAERRETPYRQQLREHKARVVSALNPAPVSGARGGHVNYQAGGTVPAPVERPTPITGGGDPIPGHPEGTNPNRPGTALYRRWEMRYHYDLPTEPEVTLPPEDEGGGVTAWILDKLGLSGTADIKSRSEQELEEIGEARGGYVRRYQVGGLAQAQQQVAAQQGMMQQRAQFRPPRGGIPPSLRGRTPRAGGIPPRMDPGVRTPGTLPGQALPGGPPSGGGGIPGGPRVPPNMRGYLQRQRMMNRPPANVGGGANRVGMQDQQGGLARALQRGTGRPPMSRRTAFPGGR